jgi:hypothetical protein
LTPALFSWGIRAKVEVIAFFCIPDFLAIHHEALLIVLQED